MLDVRAVRRLAREALSECDADGRATESLKEHLQALDSTARFSPGGQAAFEDLLARVGVATSRLPGLPLDSEPFWFRGNHPLATYRSATQLPPSADVVIVALA